MNKKSLRWSIPAAVLLLVASAPSASASEWGISGRGWSNYSPFSLTGASTGAAYRRACPPASVSVARAAAVRPPQSVPAARVADRDAGAVGTTGRR